MHSADESKKADWEAFKDTIQKVNQAIVEMLTSPVGDADFLLSIMQPARRIVQFDAIFKMVSATADGLAGDTSKISALCDDEDLPSVMEMLRKIQSKLESDGIMPNQFADLMQLVDSFRPYLPTASLALGLLSFMRIMIDAIDQGELVELSQFAGFPNDLLNEARVSYSIAFNVLCLQVILQVGTLSPPEVLEQSVGEVVGMLPIGKRLNCEALTVRKMINEGFRYFSTYLEIVFSRSKFTIAAEGEYAMVADASSIARAYGGTSAHTAIQKTGVIVFNALKRKNDPRFAAIDALVASASESSIPPNEFAAISKSLNDLPVNCMTSFVAIADAIDGEAIRAAQRRLERGETKPPAPRPRLVVRLDPPHAIYDGIPYVLTCNCALLLEELRKADGASVSATKIGVRSRDKADLPQPLADLIETMPGGGTRICREKLWLS